MRKSSAARLASFYRLAIMLVTVALGVAIYLALMGEPEMLPRKAA